MGIEYNPFSLEDKTILVTGASSGIGMATAIECSKMGARLIITGRNEERLQDTLNQLEGNEHQMIVADLVNENEIRSLVDKVPVLDGVVLSTGRVSSIPILFATREKFNPIFDINFFSPIELFRLLVKSKRIAKDSSVVFIVSIGGTEAFTPGGAIYGASKAALNSMISYCAIEFAPKKIRVNGICPGMVETPLIHDGIISETQMKADKERYLMKRYGNPEDVAYAAIYLLSDASSWMTGQSIIIDGGITVR